MSQQINLFNPIFLKQKKYFSAVTMAQALGLILLGSVGLSVYTKYQVSALSKEAETAATQLASTQTQLNRVNAAYGPQRKNKLDEDILAAEEEIKSLQNVSEILRNGEFGNTRGYGEYMRAFSRQIVPGVWLTGFTINGAGGGQIGIQGRALKPDLVPAYLGQLKREPSLQGKAFVALEMQGAQSDKAGKEDPAAAKQRTEPAYIEFDLRSYAAKKDQAESMGASNK